MSTAKLTIHLQEQDLEFAERYARERQISVSMLVDQLLQTLRIHEEIAKRNGPDVGSSWDDFFHLGDQIAEGDHPDLPTLTATVSALRR